MYGHRRCFIFTVSPPFLLGQVMEKLSGCAGSPQVSHSRHPPLGVRQPCAQWFRGPWSGAGRSLHPGSAWGLGSGFGFRSPVPGRNAAASRWHRLAAGLGGQGGGLVLPNSAAMEVLDLVWSRSAPSLKRPLQFPSPGCNSGLAHITAVPEHSSRSSLLVCRWGN